MWEFRKGEEGLNLDFGSPRWNCISTGWSKSRGGRGGLAAVFILFLDFLFCECMGLSSAIFQFALVKDSCAEEAKLNNIMILFFF